MSKQMKWQSLKGQQCMYMTASRIEGMMCGVTQARQMKDGSIELTYEDGTTESAPCPDVDIGSLKSLFEVVSMVQERARHGFVESTNAK